MSRNRLRNSNSLHLTTVLKVVLMLALIASLGLSYIFLDNRQKRLANEISKQETQLKVMTERNLQMQSVIDRLKSPAALERRVAGSNLVKLTELEIVRMDQGTGAPRLARTAGNEGRTP